MLIHWEGLWVVPQPGNHTLVLQTDPLGASFRKCPFEHGSQKQHFVRLAGVLTF